MGHVRSGLGFHGPYHSLQHPLWDGTSFTPEDQMVKNKTDIVGHLETAIENHGFKLQNL